MTASQSTVRLPAAAPERPSVPDPAEQEPGHAGTSDSNWLGAVKPLNGDNGSRDHSNRGDSNNSATNSANNTKDGACPSPGPRRFSL